MKILLVLLLITSLSIHGSGQTLEKALTTKDTLAALQYLKKGADINAPLSNGSTLLMNYCRWGNDIDMVSFLLRHGATPDAPRSPKGRTALMVACAYYSGVQVVQLLVDAKANVKATDNDGITPLMLAAQNAKLGTVKFLISKGANITAKDKNGATALDYARRAAELEYIKSSVKDDTIDQAAVIALLQKK